MEYILDELKQFTIKKVNDFENKNDSYLLVFYSDNLISPKNIGYIEVINTPNLFRRENNIVSYEENNIISYRENISSWRSCLNELFLLDKKINYDDILEIIDFVLSDSNINTTFQIFNSFGKNNHKIYENKINSFM